jgi:hypothetical protein
VGHFFHSRQAPFRRLPVFSEMIALAAAHFCMPLPLLLPDPLPMLELPAPVVLEGLPTQVCWPLMAFSQDAIV